MGYDILFLSFTCCNYSSPTHTATAECDDPGTPFLGSRRVLGTTEGSVVTYSCNSGFKLVGDSQRTCLATGEWSGSLPFCNSKALTGIYISGR